MYSASPPTTQPSPSLSQPAHPAESSRRRPPLPNRIVKDIGRGTCSLLPFVVLQVLSFLVPKAMGDETSVRENSYTGLRLVYAHPNLDLDQEFERQGELIHALSSAQQAASYLGFDVAVTRTYGHKKPFGTGLIYGFCGWQARSQLAIENRSTGTSLTPGGLDIHAYYFHGGPALFAHLGPFWVLPYGGLAVGWMTVRGHVEGKGPKNYAPYSGAYGGAEL